jgi:hypothetical protein
VLVVQVTSLTFDDTALNRTKVTGVVIETLDDGILAVPSSATEIVSVGVLVEETIDLASASVKSPIDGDSVRSLDANKNSAYNKGLKIIQHPIDFENYYNVFNTATTYINTATATPILAMRSFINVLTMPSKFIASSYQRINVLLEAFNSFRDNLFGLVSNASKEIYCAQQASLLAAMSEAASNPLEGDFKLNTEI